MVISGNKMVDETYSRMVKQSEKILDFSGLFKTYYETEDPVIFNKIVEGFQRIILDVANHFKDNLNSCNLDIMDLIQECNMNLCKALKSKSYKLDSKVKPTTYFYTAFINALSDYTGYNQVGFSSTPYTTNKISDVKKYLDEVQKGTDSKEAMKKYKLSNQDIINYSPKCIKSMYDTINNNNENERDTYIIDTIYDDNNKHIDDLFNKESLYEILKKSLSDRDYNIIVKRYIEGYSAKEIAESMNIKVNDVYDSCAKSFSLLRKNEKLKQLNEII